ncbi:hypothetical protein PVAP13_2NG419303, partial [Panicum virgatum]
LIDRPLIARQQNQGKSVERDTHASASAPPRPASRLVRPHRPLGSWRPGPGGLALPSPVCPQLQAWGTKEQAASRTQPPAPLPAAARRPIGIVPARRSTRGADGGRARLGPVTFSPLVHHGTAHHRPAPVSAKYPSDDRIGRRDGPRVGRQQQPAGSAPRAGWVSPGPCRGPLVSDGGRRVSVRRPSACAPCRPQLQEFSSRRYGLIMSLGRGEEMVVCRLAPLGMPVLH